MLEATITAAPKNIATGGDSLREAFGKALAGLGYQNPEFVVFDADVAGGTGVHHFRQAHPKRFYQFGIAEQNMIAAAGGFAATGLPVFVTTFAAFMLRGLEQVRLSVAYANRNVKLVASHPGIDVGPDGGSAQCLEDLAAFRAIPNLLVICPCDAKEMSQATEAILKYQGPVYMRTGRSPAPRFLNDEYKFEIGKAKIIQQGKDVSIIACGVEVYRALSASIELAKQGISARVINMSSIKPIDEGVIVQCAIDTRAIVTAEDHSIYGGLGGAVAEVVARTAPCPIEFVGVQDSFGESGEPDELAKKYQIDSTAIVSAALRVINRKST